MTTDTSPLPFAPVTHEGLTELRRDAECAARSLLTAYSRGTDFSEAGEDHFLEAAIREAELAEDMLDANIARYDAEEATR